ncbi:endonuclease MutS2 [Leadbetterella sp. DM7]|uniref:endonuclease MutS2 n=1 Tax=Leadbetterella sp. DM7 TaxID=3235085 RepID=UPI00349EDB65
MLYPKNIETKLGFDKIKELLEEECVSSLGKSFVGKMRFSAKFDQIRKMMAQTAEFRLILETESAFPNQHYIDVTEYLKKAAIPGAIIYEEEFFEIRLSLTTIQQIIHFFHNRPAEKFPELLSLMQAALPPDRPRGWETLLTEITSVIDERGKVRDNASKELFDIRRKLAVEQANVKRTLDRIYRTAKNSGWIGEEMTLAVRNGRLVLPVLAEHKRKLSGFVHDETSTGNIAYVEPGEVLEANNEIRDLEIRERREVLRILEQLTSRLRPELPDLERSYVFLGLMDFIRAKARLAIRTDSTFPLLVEDPVVDWQNARHPLLLLAHRKQNKPVVPLRVSLNSEERILVVSGPNAGGKSVMLKTIGLVQYMAQCGMLLPVSPDSKIGLFKSLFIDIGDEQSIENDLSTYSSHLTNMREFLRHADQDTLFLIDEFGTGTEPSLGGALAESILESFAAKKAFGVINTHYTNLKVFADKNEGLLNGAMRFDSEELTPMFELEMGKPGNSFAFEVAQKMGLPAHIIKNAQRKLGKNQINFEKLLKELDIEKKAFAEQNALLQKQVEELKERAGQYTALKNFLESDKQRIISQAKEDAKKIVRDANKTIENTIRHIKENNAEKEASRRAREQVKEFAETVLQPEPEAAPKVIVQKADGPIMPGDYVRIKGQEALAQVLSLNGKDAEILLGELKSNIRLNRLEKISRKEFRSSQKESAKSMKGVDLNEKMTGFSFNLDIRGKRGEEALIEVDNLVDDAILLGYPQLRIVHGKGDGILRNLIRNHIKQYKQVGKMYDEHADRGGAGVTIVEMK